MGNSGIHSNQAIGLFDSLDLERPARYQFEEIGHDASTCVILNGKIAYANSEERFSLKKHDGSSTKNVILDIRRHLDKNLSELEDWQKIPKHHFIRHHVSHIYEAFYNSGFDDAAVFVNDGCGNEGDCITLAYMKRGEEPLILKKFDKKCSLGLLYTMLSSCIFSRNNTNFAFSEGKLMGLASYGTPIKDLTIVDVINNDLVWNVDFLKSMGIITKVVDNGVILGSEDAFFSNLPILIQANYAATLQRDFESCSVKIIKMLHSLLKEKGIETKNLCMSGGCILNCPTNSKIIDLGLFEHYYASPNPTDGGVCFGILYEELIKEDKQNAFQYERLSSPYLGYNYSYDEILEDLRYAKFYNEYKPWLISSDDNTLNILCNYLAEQKILCWYQGAAEFGPRALGHRSLLADPRAFRMNQKLNKIKGREAWRPLAPVVPEELFKDVFEVDNTDLCEFMLRTLKIKEKWVPMLKAVCHVDGTARPQLLKKSLNPELYNLLMLWYRKTGCPALINTSLNLAGLPIVERSSQVLDLMHTSDSQELIGVFVGSSTEMTVVPNII